MVIWLELRNKKCIITVGLQNSQQVERINYVWRLQIAVGIIGL